MSVAQVILLALQLSIALAVVSVGMRATLADVGWLLRRPMLLARSIIAMNVILPLVAVAVVLLFDLHPALRVAIVALSVSPVPPILPGKQTKAGGTSEYIVALLVVMSLVSIVFIPSALEVLRQMFVQSAHVPEAGAIALIVVKSVLGPLAVGMIVRALAPQFADRVAHPLGRFATILLLVAFVPVVFKAWGSIVALIGDFSLVAIATITLVGLGVGHLLGGPDADDRTVLAISTATRHPGVAIAIANVSAPNQDGVLAAVLLYLLAGAVFSIPYVKWRQRVHARKAAA